MDITSLLGSVTSADSVAGLSQAAGTSTKNVQSVLSAALPSLLNGAVAQSQNSETAEGFANALSQHAASDTSNLASFLGSVDLKDGAKIVSHLLGGNSASVVSQVSEQTGVSQEETSGILSAAAPLLMSLMGQQTGSEQASGAGIAGIMSSLMGKTDVTSLLSGLLGGAASSEDGKTGSGGILGTVLGLFK